MLHLDHAYQPSVTHSLALPKIFIMYNLLEYSDNHSMTSGSLWNNYRDEMKFSAIKINDDGNKINNYKKITSKSFEYKTKIIGSTPNGNNTLHTEVVVTLKYLSNFWRFLDFPLINFETELNLSWSKECIRSEISITPTIIFIIFWDFFMFYRIFFSPQVKRCAIIT